MWAAHVAWCMDLNQFDFLGHEYFGYSVRLEHPWARKRYPGNTLWSEDLWDFR